MLFKNMWNYIDPWIDRRQYAFVSISIFTGLLILFSSITTQKVSSPSDLISVEGTLANYSFLEGKRGSKKYYIWLEGHEATYQIPADFLSFFDKENFVEAISKGEKLYVEISKSGQNFLQSHDNIFIYGLHTDKISFLKSNLTISKQNNNLEYLTGLLFIVAGICFYFFKRRKLACDKDK